MFINVHRDFKFQSKSKCTVYFVKHKFDFQKHTKGQSESHVKEEIFHTEQNGNDTANEINCTYIEDFNSDINNCNDIASITNKKEMSNNEKLDGLSEKVIITYNVDDKDKNLLTKSTYLRHNSHANINKTSHDSISRKVKNLLVCKICQKEYGKCKLYVYQHCCT